MVNSSQKTSERREQTGCAGHQTYMTFGIRHDCHWTNSGILRRGSRARAHHFNTLLIRERRALSAVPTLQDRPLPELNGMSWNDLNVTTPLVTDIAIHLWVSDSWTQTIKHA